MVAENARIASHVRSFERSQTFYDWRHYVPDGHPSSPVYGHLKLPHLN